MLETPERNNILDYTPEELETIVTGMGGQKFRAKQVFGWLSKGAATYDEMSNVPKDLREKLAEKYPSWLPEAVRMQKSKDGTVKCLFRFADGTEVESVFMKYEYGNSICIGIR